LLRNRQLKGWDNDNSVSGAGSGRGSGCGGGRNRIWICENSPLESGGGFRVWLREEFGFEI